MKQQRGLSHAVFACILLVVWSGPARSEGASASPAPGAANSAPPIDPERAAAAYKESLARYATGDLVGALASMNESYRLSDRPELLYNLARLEAELNDCPAALSDYRKYVVAVPQGQYRPEAERVSQELQARCGAGNAPIASDSSEKPAVDSKPAQVAPAPPAVLPSKSQPAAHDLAPGYFTPTRWVGWSLIATSALAGAGALYVRALAVETRDDFKASVDDELEGRGQANQGLEDKQHRQERWAAALGITAGALLGGGIAVLLMEPKSGAGSATRETSRLTTAKLSLGLEPGGLRASFVHAF